MAVLGVSADGICLSSVAPWLPLLAHSHSSDALKVVAGDAIVAGGHGAGVAVCAGRIVIVRSQSVALTQ